MEKYLKTAIQAAIEAGAAIMQVYETPFDVELKEDDSPLTQADKKANDVINRYLETTPFPIISEENKQTDYSTRKDWDQCWIVDPLDGTKEFVKRNGEFTVNIALIKDEQTLLGVIYVPVSKTLYFTAADAKKAFKIQLTSDTMDIDTILTQANEIQPEDPSENSPLKIVGSRSHLNEDTKAFISEKEKRKAGVEIVSKGSSLKFCLVAEGDAHMYPRFAPTMEWDTAAGQAICQAVGIQVIDQETGAPLKYNRENLLNPHFLVS
ncbi:MAG: 3'(2'),5'-bisphosphate nucleotidase CysQ [Flavobacteriaceae bacterium]|nr:3'(2'),5'-bisphosphate nucleotidase CysQ [Flavobacteriaceae bacterium]